MTTPYNQSVGRAGIGFDAPGGVGDALVPEPLAASIIQEMPKSSAALSLFKKTILSTKTQRIPVLDLLPIAYWVGGDTGLKQTSTQAWKNVVMVVEELACIIPIPQAYLDDADVPIWSEVQPRMTEAAGNLIDAAVFWDINKPATWGTSVFGGAVAAGNTILDGTGVDFAQSVTQLGDHMSNTGYTVNGFAGRPGLNWRLLGLRSSQGIPIYEPDLQSGGMGGSMYGYPISLVENGSWESQNAQMLMGDFSKGIIGVRQDISFKMFTEGVISDNTGKVILNLMQQDAVAMRMVMRLAYATVNPTTLLMRGVPIGTRWPFGAVTSVGYLVGGRQDTLVGTTNLSATVTDTHAVAADAGGAISGTGIPAGTTILTVTPGVGYTMSQVATATGTITASVGAEVGARRNDPNSIEVGGGPDPVQEDDPAPVTKGRK